MNVMQQGVIALLHSAVTGESRPLPEGFSLEEAFDLLKDQHLIALAYEGASKCGISDQTEVMKKMLGICYKYLIYSERQMQTVEKLLRIFEEKGIAHLPFKGCLLKGLYPKPELRVMGDADILIRLEQLKQAEAFMEELGFRQKSNDDHVSFWKSEALSVELHKCLVPPMDKDFYGYYGTGWHLAVRKTQTRYELSCEDMFVFLLVHLARHYRYSGIGCKHILDLYLYRRANPGMNQRHIRRELDKLCLLEFYDNILRLLEVWFGGAQSNPVTDVMTDHIFSGGSFGNLKNLYVFAEVKKSHEKGEIKNTRMKLLKEVLFPPVRKIGKKYPVLYRFPALLPLVWILRWFDVVLHRPGRIAVKAKGVQTVRDETVNEYQQALRLVGLDFFEPET